MAWPRGAGGSALEPAPAGDVELQLHQVEPGRLLGDRVLDLQPRVDLHEREAPAHPGRRGTPPCRRWGTRPVAQSRTAACSTSWSWRRAEGDRRRLLDHLLVCGAGSCSPAHRPATRRRSGRRSPGPRRGETPAAAARGTRCRRRRTSAPRPVRRSKASARAPGRRRARMPRPPPPAVAFTIKGKPMRAAWPRASASDVTGAAAPGRDGHAGLLGQPLRS